MLLLSGRDGCAARLGAGAVADTDVSEAAPAMLPATCCDDTGEGLAPGVAALLTAEAAVTETGTGGNVPALETALPDVGA